MADAAFLAEWDEAIDEAEGLDAWLSLVDEPVELSQDAEGREHKGKGPGGGQFAKGSGSGGGTKKEKKIDPAIAAYRARIAELEAKEAAAAASGGPIELQSRAAFERGFKDAFVRLDTMGGGFNLVGLHDLHKSLGVKDKAAFDKQVTDLWRARKIRLSPAEGRHGLGKEEIEAQLEHGGEKFLFVSLAPTQLSFLDPIGSEEGSAETGSADPIIEQILERTTPAADAAFMELRQRLRDLVKKKPRPS
jgi:hypothetical protein